MAIGALAAILGAVLPPLIAYMKSGEENKVTNALKTAGVSIPASGALYESLQGGNQGGLFTGTPGKTEQHPIFEQDQLGFLKNLLGNLGNVGPNTGRFNFEPVAQKELSRFRQDIVPGLAERFTSLGTGGSQRSSAFQGALGQAGAGLSESLASLGSQFGLKQQALDQSQLATLLGAALQPRTTGQYFQGQPGLLQGISGGLSQGIGQQLGRSIF